MLFAVYSYDFTGSLHSYFVIIRYYYWINLYGLIVFSERLLKPVLSNLFKPALPIDSA